MVYPPYQSNNNGILPPPPNPPVGLGLIVPSQPPLPSNMPPPNPDQQNYQQQMHQMQHFQQQQQFHLQQQFMNPALNDQPLDFNRSKNKPPIINEQGNGNDIKRDDMDERHLGGRDRRGDRDRGGRDRRDRRDRDRDRMDDRIRDDGDGNPQAAMANPMQNMGMMPMSGMMGGMMGPGMMAPGMMPMMGGMDPAMMGMGQFGMMPNLMEGDGSMQRMGNMMGPDGMYNNAQRNVIEFKECTLVAPSPNAMPPATRERPPGCRTVYVGGLPDNITEDIIRDVFSRCGEMLSVRLSKKNFCHIRFDLEESVDAAMLFSGYRMRIGNNMDAANTGRLHVDFAQARVDQYEYECKQRSLQREQRHRERMERDRLRPASPPPIPHYTDHEAGNVAETMKTDDGFMKAAATVIAWLERGDLSKRNANTFYTIIQSTYSHVRRLLNEKMAHEEELRAAKDLHRTRVYAIITQFDSIEKVFTCASHKKCWDHFTKAQRKNIETWKKQSHEIKQLQLVGSMNEEEMDEEMELSDEEGPNKKRTKNDASALKEENEGLKTQLEAFKNEVELVKGDLKFDLDEKERKIKMLQQTIQNMSNELTMSNKNLLRERDLVQQLKAAAKKEEAAATDNESKTCEEKELSSSSEESNIVTDRDAKLIGLISTFLHVHPFGAGVDYIWSYLSKLDPTVRVSEVDLLMTRFPTVFKQELCGIGATLERRWIFCGFNKTPME